MSWSLQDLDYGGFRTIHLGWKSVAADLLFSFLSYSGLGVSVAIFAICLALYSPTRKFCAPILFSILLGGTVFAQSFKTLMPRLRPSNLSWAIPQEAHLQSSFPSAHTACAFAAATVLFIMLVKDRRPNWGILALVWALGVGLSRIYRGVHWPTDVIAGAMLGILAGCLVSLMPIFHVNLSGKTKA